jgi:hypothetical protein
MNAEGVTERRLEDLSKDELLDLQIAIVTEEEKLKDEYR